MNSDVFCLFFPACAGIHCEGKRVYSREIIWYIGIKRKLGFPMYDGFWYIGVAMNWWIPMYFVCFCPLARGYTTGESGYIRGKFFEYIGIGWKLGFPMYDGFWYIGMAMNYWIPMYFVLAIFGDTSEIAWIGPSRCVLYIDLGLRTSGWA